MISLLMRHREKAPQAAIIAPYGAEAAAVLRPWRWLLIAAFGGFCVVYGFFFALTAPQMIVPFTAPLAILALLSIWALPDLKTAPTGPMLALLLAFTVCLFAWPNYLAIALPGLPWITLLRLTGTPMVLLFLICLSVSKEFREQLAAPFTAVPPMLKMMVVFVIIQGLTIVFSSNIPGSIQKFIVFQTNWTAVFFVGCYAFLKPGRAERYIFTIWLLALFVAGLGLWESFEKRLLWQGHIPGFLKIEDADNIFKASIRWASGMYRVKSTFSTPLGLAEYLALSAPIALHMAAGRYNVFVKAAGAVSLLVFFHVIQLTDSRLGIAGLLVGMLVYLLGWSLVRWYRDRRSILASAFVFAYPAVFCAVVAATFFVGKLRRMVWGGGAQAASSDAREAQVNKGIPIIMTQPWGHGPGEAGHALGYYSHGFLTIDNYYLSIALEYGVAGFVLYYGLILLAIWYGGVAYVKASNTGDREFDLLLPIGATLATFVIIKMVFSQQDNHPLIYLLLGMLVALVYRVKVAQAAIEPGPAKGSHRSGHRIAAIGRS